ncbi:MAG: TetR/AcrR family transcriptional regulator [Gammaproteobacteria bacterium]
MTTYLLVGSIGAMDTRDQLLQTAREQIQRKGYNGFSYADLANAVGIRKASIHHHFPTKENLGTAVAVQYRHDFMSALQSIESSKQNYVKKLKAYIQLFRQTLEQDHKVCLCIMLAANHDSLPDTVRAEVKGFFQENEKWLTQLLLQGKKAGDFEFKAKATEIAKSILSALEGAMVIAESMDDPGRLASVTPWILSSVEKRQVT